MIIPFIVHADETSTVATTITIKTGFKAPNIDIVAVEGKVVSLQADTSESGLPDGTTLKWEVEQAPSITTSGMTASIELPAYTSDYTIKLSAIPPQGSAFTVTKQVTTGYGIPKITSQKIGGSGLDYQFDVDLNGTGIPASGVSYKWYVDGASQGTSTNFKYIFAGENKTYVVKAEVEVGGKTITAETSITTGAADQPSLTVSQVGDSPVSWKIDVDITNTVIDASWSKEWFVNGELKSSTGTSFSPDSLEPGITYSVEFKAKKDSLVRQATVSLKTGYGMPKITSQQIGGSGLDYQFDVDFAGTGIPATGITYTWYVNGAIVSNSKSFTHIFSGENQTYVVKLEAKFAGETVTSETNINTGAAEQHNLRASQVGGDSLSWKIDADTTNTVIQPGWTKEWYIDGNKDSETSATLNHVFTDYASVHNARFVAISLDGSLTREATLNLTTGYGTPTITSKQIGGSGLDYQFDVDITGTGIPAAGITYTWYVNGSVDPNSTSSNFTKVFEGENKTYTVKAEIKVGEKIVIAEKTISTGAADQPSMVASPFGSSPLEWLLSVDMSNTIIDDSWKKEWYANGQLIHTGNTNVVHTFPVTGTTYNVEFKATKGSLVRTATTEVVVAPATSPQVDADGSAVEGDLKYLLTANLISTGITNDWSFDWSSSPAATFSTNESTTVATFPSYSTSYTVTLTATPPSNLNNQSRSGLRGSIGQQPVIQTKSVRVGDKPPEYPSQVTYSVDSGIGVTAQQIASYYNSTLGIPDGVASITASGNNLIFTCKSTYYVSQAAADIKRSKTEQNYSKQHNTPSDYYAAGYSKRNGLYGGFMKVLGNEAYNNNVFAILVMGGAQSSYTWGVNCFKLS
jgi:hypothetical protein